MATDGDGDAQYETYTPRPVNYLEEAINIVPRHVSPSQSSHRVIQQDVHPIPLPDDTIPRISGGKCNRDQDGESTDEASPSHKRARREKGTLPLDANQPLTTRGKPRARVYVACLQWYVAHTPHRLPAHPPFQPQPENPLRRRSACVSQLHSERKSGVQL